MQAKDIPDAAFLAAIDTVLDIRDQGPWPSRNLGSSACDIQMVLAGQGDQINDPRRSWDDIPTMPLKVVLAKAKALIRRGLITGCACGCRGDFNRTSSAPPPGGPDYGTSGGVPITDELITRLAAESEAGYPAEQLVQRSRRLVGE